MDKKPITPEGQQKLRSELDNLKNIKRQEIIDAISEARAHGDLKENAEYHAAREEQGLNEARIRELEEALGLSQAVEYKSIDNQGRVIFGSTVEIKNLETEEKHKYQIVGEAEADIEMNTISLTTPIAQSLMKKELGDVAEVETPSGLKEFEIVNIEII
ncbi:MAG: transcription elongation factor GreA [Rickettsiales bacterium TMED289]|nr:transcription elongation factor GreA [Gammaproteobacteria bacterium]MAJ89980.1 transcription elongation factor GreA [Flavobacteriales bacterium]RPF74758.1 MAG: transcription elongation factor GreA [Rickettsiales bacterium TMED289]|tara:strand:- start:54 stop:530 length:477 start_codon:yes stop_codon:yes gene_type:complete